MLTWNKSLRFLFVFRHFVPKPVASVYFPKKLSPGPAHVWREIVANMEAKVVASIVNQWEKLPSGIVIILYIQLQLWQGKLY